MIIYRVVSGDSLFKIARNFGVTLQELQNANGLDGASSLPIGTALVIPTRNTSTIVRRGDSLFSIATEYGLTVPELLQYNPNIRPPYTIIPGDTIILPPGSKLGTIAVNGYCYPNISDETLQKTLPYLTYISIFSYDIRPDGSLKGLTNDDRIIAAAREANVAPLMTVTNLNADQSFDSDLSLKFLRNDVAQRNFIDGIPDYLKQKGYMGLNLDFEYVYAENREDYNVFMRALGERLRAEGLILTTALAPKSSDNQQGILFEGHDYRALGEACDWILLMTYDWGYVAGPPMAVSPINEVERVLRYATKIIPSQKLMMGFPNYAYDWTLPYTPGTKAKYLTHSGAVDLAARTGSTIRFDTTSATPFFSYKDASGNEHVVWFDDARSIEAKLKLINEYDLLGLGIWTINRFYPPLYAVLSSMYDIQKLL